MLESHGTPENEGQLQVLSEHIEIQGRVLMGLISCRTRKKKRKKTFFCSTYQFKNSKPLTYFEIGPIKPNLEKLHIYTYNRAAQLIFVGTAPSGLNIMEEYFH